MQISEFIEATSRLESYYDKEYTKEQRQIMFEEMKDFKLERYKKVISAVIRKSKYLPKVADLLEANAELIHENIVENNKVDCPICNGEGYVYYTKIIEKMEYNYACRCTCENGRNKDKSIPTFEEIGIKPARVY